MSIKNILSQNDYTGYFENLNISGALTAENVSISELQLGILNVNNSINMESQASINFLGSGEINMGSGSIILNNGSNMSTSNSTININDGTTSTFASGSSTIFNDSSTLTCNNIPIFNNTIAVPNIFYFNNNNYGNLNVYYTSSLDTLGTLIGTTTINFYNIGGIKVLQIKPFTYQRSTSGYYQIDITPASNYYFPDIAMEFLVPVSNGDGNIQTGAFLTSIISTSKYLTLMYSPNTDPFIAFTATNSSGLISTSFIFY